MSTGKILFLNPATGRPKQAWASDVLTVDWLDAIAGDLLRIAGAGTSAIGVEIGSGFDISKIITIGSPTLGRVQIEAGNVKLTPGATGSVLFGSQPGESTGFQLLANTGASVPAGLRYNDSSSNRWEFRIDDDTWTPFVGGWTLEADPFGNLQFIQTWSGAIPAGIYDHDHMEWIYSGGAFLWSIRQDITLPDSDAPSERKITVSSSDGKAGTPLRIKSGSGGTGDYNGSPLVLEAGSGTGSGDSGWLQLLGGARIGDTNTDGGITYGRPDDLYYPLYALTRTIDTNYAGIRFGKNEDRWEHKTDGETDIKWRPISVATKALAAETILSGMAIGFSKNSVTAENILWKVDPDTALASDTTPYVRGLAFNEGIAGATIHIVENGDLPIDITSVFSGTTPTTNHIGYRVWALTTGGASAGLLTIDEPTVGYKTKVGFIKGIDSGSALVSVQIGDTIYIP